MARQNKESSLTPAQRISFDLIEVFVPRIFMQTAEAASFYGTMAQDNANAQKEQEQGDMRVNLPATRLAELYAKGCKPWFVYPERSLKMYQDLVNYLRQAEMEFNRNPTSNRFKDEMMDNLLMLENFAHWLHGVAKPYINPNDNLDLKGTLAGYRRFTPLSRKSHAEQQAEAQRQQHQEPDHVRVVDDLIERQVARNRRGWS